MNVRTVTIRRAKAEDAAPLAVLAARTFEDAFGAGNRPEDMAAHLAASYSEQLQGAEIADPAIVTLVADSDGALVAYAQIRRGSAVPPCVNTAVPVELWRFYVDREWHGQGLAQRLMTASLDAARELGGRSVWLSVWERNPRALTFYAKCGFVDCGSKDFIVGSDRQTDRVYVRAID